LLLYTRSKGRELQKRIMKSQMKMDICINWKTAYPSTMIRKEIYQQAKLLGLRCQSYETFSLLIADYFPK